ncbi:ankyrin repeat family protein [Orientia chuto str. Dubai]|uniref:Ankyrin repeat family protein n=1 Tax=Orientia chuto str. Dubai TaxID=1359168 RepID=A0A0F3MI43_9RICK|nr:ankyrin repeat domain-containing protein [Candidatus Orientia mediorientalis]KJV55326.1 ankyrin repeat family protein [Orientia chuto str. Dubai]
MLKANFHNAIKKNNLEKVQYFSNRDSTIINEKDKDGCTALLIALKYSNVEIAKILLNNIATDINAIDTKNNTALHYAINCNDNFKELEIVKLLLERGADPNAKDCRGNTPFYYAVVAWEAQYHDPLAEALNYVKTDNYAYYKSHMETFLEYGANIFSKNIYQETPFAYALEYNRKEAIDIMLKHTKAKVLHIAVAHCDLNAVKNLLESKVSVNEKLDNGMTPLHIAACSGNRNLKIMKILLQNIADVADVNAQNDSGDTPLHIAVHVFKKNSSNIKALFQKDDLAAIKLLLKYGANPDKKDNDGNTSACIAIMLNKPEVASFLFNQHKANIHESDNDGDTILHKAVVINSTKAVEFCITKGANVNATNHHGESPLHKAAMLNYIECIQVLTQNGADVNQTDNSSRSPAYYAIRSGSSQDVIKLLVDNNNSVEEADNDQSLNAIDSSVSGNTDNNNTEQCLVM